MELIQCALYVALIGVASHFIGEALPRKWFDPDNCLFRCRPWEDRGRVYHKLKIRRWKDKLPDASRHCKKMVPKRIRGHLSRDHLDRMIQETCVAEFIHSLLILLSIGVVRIWEGKRGWICWLLCILGNLPFIFIQRYNRPRLQAALEHMENQHQTAQ